MNVLNDRVMLVESFMEQFLAETSGKRRTYDGTERNWHLIGQFQRRAGDDECDSVYLLLFIDITCCSVHF